jgi:hypothetical protein
MEVGSPTEQRELYFTYLNEMNYCYVSWAASEARNLRGKFADSILAFEKDPN